MIHALLKLPGTKPFPGTKPAISLMYTDSWGFSGGSAVKNLLANSEDRVQSLGQENPLERKWQFTPVFWPGKPTDRGAWWTTVHGVAKSRT